MKSALRLGGDEKQDKEKTREQSFVDALDLFLSSIAEDKKNRKTFVGKNYFDYLKELKAKGCSDVLGNLILFQIGSEEALNWLTDNESRLDSSSEWARAYEI